MASSIVLSWYHHQPESHQQSFTKFLYVHTDIERPGPIDWTPETPGSGKNVPILIYILYVFLHRPSIDLSPPCKKNMFKLEERTLASFLLWHPRTLYYSLLVFPIQDDTGEKVPFFPIREGVLLFIPVFSAAPQPLLAASLNSSFQHIKELQLGRRQGREERHFLVRKHTYVTSAQSRD